MKKSFLAAAAFVFLLSSCTKTTELDNIVDAGIKTTDVSINLETQYDQGEKSSSSNEVASKAAASYVRGNAPVYVSGVKVTATYAEGISNVVKGDFDFVDMGDKKGDAITMSIPLGSNVFASESKPTYKAANTVYSNNIKLSTAKDRQLDYSAKLIKEQGIYAMFNGTTTKTITDTDKAVALAMTTEHARYNVVLETSLNYDVKMDVTCQGVLHTVKANTSENASAIVLNDAELTGSNAVTVTLYAYAHNSKEIVKTQTLTYKTKPSVNTTLVVSYNASGEFIVVETGISFSWVPMSDEGEVVNID